MLVVVSRENITTAAAPHKFVTAVLQMASSSIFPTRLFAHPRAQSEARPCRFGGEGQKLALSYQEEEYWLEHIAGARHSLKREDFFAILGILT